MVRVTDMEKTMRKGSVVEYRGAYGVATLPVGTRGRVAAMRRRRKSVTVLWDYASRPLRSHWIEAIRKAA